MQNDALVREGLKDYISYVLVAFQVPEAGTHKSEAANSLNTVIELTTRFTFPAKIKQIAIYVATPNTQIVFFIAKALEEDSFRNCDFTMGSGVQQQWSPDLVNQTDWYTVRYCVTSLL